MRPEGVEDLAIWREGALSEVIQVKSLAAPLVLSDLDPSSVGSFFHAAASRVQAGGTELLTVASFGALGTEIAGFASGVPEARNKLRTKLASAGVLASAVDAVLDRLTFQLVDETTLEAEIGARLAESLTGVDPSAAFDLLTLWIYVASEARVDLTSADVQAKVVAVGRFLADRRDHHSHWFTTIVPISEPTLTDDQRSRYAAEFYQGVAVRYEHVSAGLAVDRPDRLAELDRAFATERIVISHAASGQGKTTLAYLFMRQLPEAWRFSVRLVENRIHAIEVARALAGHAKAMGVPLFVHLDAGPRDDDWPTLVRELAAEPQVRVLVTIREEDWRRSLDTWAFPSADVDLTFSRDEALGIYDGLRERFPDAPPTFADAWTRFGGSGPLLEFVYLVTQREDLPGRLRDQVAVLRREAEGTTEPGPIELLRLVAVLSESGARAFARPLTGLLELRDPAAVLARLEREYLLRQTDDGVLVGGLHPVRSRLLADILTDEALAPRHESIVAAMPFVYEPDLEVLLLHALDTDGAARVAVLEAVSRLIPATWTGVSGVARALRWRGIADYANDHRQLIEAVDPGRTGAWGVILNGDIADAMPGTADEIWETVRRLGRRSSEATTALETQRAEQKPGRAALEMFRVWLEGLTLPTVDPHPNEWASVGEILFFAQHLRIELPDAVERLTVAGDQAVGDASLEDLASLSLGFAEADGGWRARNRARLVESYRRRLGVTRFDDNGTRVSIDFINPGMPDRSGDSPEVDASGNWQAVSRVDLLRRLLPDRERYASQGWGHRVIDAAPDDTHKDIERRRLPPLWLTSINATFRGYVERWWREPSWSAYRSDVIGRRKTTVDRLEQITTALVRYHRRHSGSILGTDLVESELREWHLDASREHLLPTPAVDPWGFVDEASLRSTAESRSVAGAFGLALQPYDRYYRAYRDYLRPLTNFADQAPMALAVNAAIGRTEASERESMKTQLSDAGANMESTRMSMLNLLDAYEHLPAFQRESRRLFGADIPEHLEEREERVMLRAVVTWDAFIRHPSARVPDVATDAMTRTESSIRALRRRLLEGLRGIDSELTWTIDLVRSPDVGGWIKLGVDGPDGSAVYAALEAGVDAVHESLTSAPEHLRAHIRSRWPRILIAPMIRGKPLASEAIELSTLVVAGDTWETQWWHFAPRPLNEITSSLLASQPWDLDEVQLANRLSAAVGALASVALHLADLQPASELDALGQDILQNHIAALSPAPGDAWREAQSLAAEFSAVIDRLPEETPDRAVLVEISSGIRDRLLAAPGWPAGAEPMQPDLVRWASDLGELFLLVGLARVGLTTVVASR